MTVVNFRPAMLEKMQYISPDGIVYDLYDPPEKYVLMYEGDGLPPVTYGTTRGAFQHGYSVTETRVDARQMDVSIRQNACSRDGYWALRAEINDILRYNRTNMNNPSPGVLRRILSNGNVRDLDVFVSKGPVYRDNGNGWDKFSVQESLRFTAYNPILYDPTVYVESVHDFYLIVPYVTNLIFPVYFPFTFGTTYNTATKTITIPYAGDWEEYPFIRVTGPATDFKLEHQELGTILSFEGYTIDGIVDFDLTYGRKTVLSSKPDESWQGRLSDDSNLTTFRLEADPIVPGGINHLIASMKLGDVSSSVEVQYKNRYLGI